MKTRTFLLVICLFMLNLNNSYAQDIYWFQSIDFSKELAKEKNKLIIADFWASWCGPCLMMDKKVWSNNNISALAQDFVCMKFDLSYGWQNASPYTVDRIPTIMILDYRGMILYTITSYVGQSELQEILSSFPADVSELYQALEACDQDKKNHTSLVNGASAYQNYAMQTISPAKEIFIKESNKLLKKAQKLSDKQKDYACSERVRLMKAHNQIISGNYEKGSDAVIDQLDNIGEENLSLALYILVTAFLEGGNKDLARKYYNELHALSGGDAFVQLVQNEFE
ncbi:thioredoxin domain-containing protein [Bacteroidota bacterium]